MKKLIEITQQANVIIHALALIASYGKGAIVQVKKVAEALSMPEPYVAKMLQIVVKKKLIKSVRGINGGFKLNTDPDKTNMFDILVLIDGEMPKHNCLFGNPICKGGTCVFSKLNAEIGNKIETALRATTITNMAKKFQNS